MELCCGMGLCCSMVPGGVVGCSGSGFSRDPLHGISAINLEIK